MVETSTSVTKGRSGFGWARVGAEGRRHSSGTGRLQWQLYRRTETWADRRAWLLKDLHNMVANFGLVPGINQDVLNVNYGEGIDKLPEHLIHEALEKGR